ncbi:Na+/H+ antiporter NhaC family protein [uncultured Ferrimonas sp.]|uniref:Na+/H+ antiporter NhaC family protein n=1 Tax=uncultured Ferrimonas sp. TaxID=432640 RepID=UPI00262DCFE5|nr:Na+/H+ antiporter NhaC family protein [uncultured Ferrimonas sp.]
MNEFLSVFPVIFTIGVALLLRRTLVALSLGIGCATVILHWGQPLEMVRYLGSNAISQLYQQQWQSWHVNVLAAMLLLGILTSLLARSGAVSAFADWLFARIHSQRQARLAVVLLGWLVFIDGIFSCLANGNVSRPLSERYRIPPGQLAYLVDSTASPLCSVVPFSSWGPYVMALIAGIGWLEVNPASAFLEVASYNFYAIGTLLMVLVVAYSNFGFNHQKMMYSEDPELQQAGSPWQLGLPILTLLFGSLLMMLISGYRSSGSLAPMALFSNADIGAAMRNSCALAVLVAALLAMRVGMTAAGLGQALLAGLRNIAPAIAIILLTWMIGRAISDLGTGKVMAHYAAQYLSPSLLLPGLFLLCTVTAFATGSSWGTFALMIPIGADIAHAINPALLLPALSAVMAGSVFGDHCSPISDTTVLSATACGCDPHHHVVTQLPLALLTAALALLCYTAVGLGLALSLVLVALLLALAAIGAGQLHWGRRIKLI